MISKLSFSGSRDAELFTKEIEHSVRGAIDHLLDMNPESPSYGFMQASFDGRPWTDTMWTRDAGVMLRELACFGALDEAKALAECLMNMVSLNPDGYYTFPEHLDRGVPGWGHELDGTASIVIGLVFLMRRLCKNDPVRARAKAFLASPESPVAFVKEKLKNQALIAGSGEFGGGCGIDGMHVNAVQNALIRGMLIVYAQFLTEEGEEANNLIALSDVMRKGLFDLLTDENGAWLWCVNAETLLPDPEVLNHPINKGLGHINDIAALLSDIEGALPEDAEMLSQGERTMNRDYSYPRRKFLFDRFGMWLQFDLWMNAGLSSPSYAMGYALQAMALFDRTDWLSKGVRFLAEVTYDNPLPITRRDRYWFYERILAEDILDIQDSWEGCGALNLVNVAEPMKVARLIAGLDCAQNGKIVYAPRLPAHWQSISVNDWLLPMNASLVSVSCRYEHFRGNAPEGAYLSAKDLSGEGYALFWNCEALPDEVRFGPFSSPEIAFSTGQKAAVTRSGDGLYWALVTRDAE